MVDEKIMNSSTNTNTTTTTTTDDDHQQNANQTKNVICGKNTSSSSSSSSSTLNILTLGDGDFSWSLDFGRYLQQYIISLQQQQHSSSSDTYKYDTYYLRVTGIDSYHEMKLIMIEHLRLNRHHTQNVLDKVAE